MHTILRDTLFIGLPVSAAGMLGAAAIMQQIDLPPACYSAAAAAPLVIGCFAAGFTAGKRLRHSGLPNGLRISLLLTAFWYAAACFAGGRLYSHFAVLIPAVPAGICGSILGVNRPQPMPHRRSHSAMHLRETLRLFPKLLHRPDRFTEHTAESLSPEADCPH